MTLRHRLFFDTVCGLFYNKAVKRSKQIVGVVAVNGHFNGLKQVQAEDTQNRLCINDVTAGFQVDIHITFCHDADKVLHIGNGCKANANVFHRKNLLCDFINSIIAFFCLFVKAILCKSLQQTLDNLKYKVYNIIMYTMPNLVLYIEILFKGGKI